MVGGNWIERLKLFKGAMVDPGTLLDNNVECIVYDCMHTDGIRAWERIVRLTITSNANKSVVNFEQDVPVKNYTSACISRLDPRRGAIDAPQIQPRNRTTTMSSKLQFNPSELQFQTTNKQNGIRY